MRVCCVCVCVCVCKCVREVVCVYVRGCGRVINEPTCVCVCDFIFILLFAAPCLQTSPRKKRHLFIHSCLLFEYFICLCLRELFREDTEETVLILAKLAKDFIYLSCLFMYLLF